MCGERFAFWLFIVLLFTSSSTTPQNFTSAKEEDNIWEETYNHTNFIRSKQNNNNENHIVPYEKCGNITCIQLCCPLGDRLVDRFKNCTANEKEYVFPDVYFHSNDSISMERLDKKVDELFPLTVQNPCQETIRFHLYPNNINYPEDYKYKFFANSSLYLPYFDIFVESISYCLAVADDNQFDAIICWEAVKETITKKWNMTRNLLDEEKNKLRFSYLSCRIVSMLCLLTTFVVYSILPELRNIHSFMLRIYCSLLLYRYIIETIQLLYEIEVEDISYYICVIIVLVTYLCSLSSYFWLSAMSLDIWWTFRDFRSLQRNRTAKQGKRKLIYSIFAWGGPFIFTIICIIMDFVPNMPKNIIRPEFCVYYPWFGEDVAHLLYFYGPQSVCVITGFCLSISTALKIVRYEKDTVRHLRDSESRFYNDKKRWFSLYLRLFIMLFIIIAIGWILTTMYFVFRLSDYMTSQYILCSIGMLEAIQDIGTFIIFVCKKAIMRQLLKRFCKNCKCFSKTST